MNFWRADSLFRSGLYLRILGAPVTAELLEIVREADHEVTRDSQKHKLYDKISQIIVALLGTKTVGVKGDGQCMDILWLSGQ